MLALPLTCVLLLAAVDLTPEERELMATLAEPERLYVEFALQHGENKRLGLANSETLDKGMVGPFRKSVAYITVVDGSTVLMTHHLRKRNAVGILVDVPGDSFWITGLDTSGMTDDDKELKVPDQTAFVVVGNREIDAGGGKRTVKHLAAVNIETATPVLDKLLSNRNMRTWSMGKQQVRATMKTGREPVVLVTPDGKTLRVPKRVLSDDDRLWITEELRRRAER